MGAQGWFDPNNVQVNVIQDTSSGVGDNRQEYDLKDIIGYTKPDANGHYIGIGRSARVNSAQFPPKMPANATGIPHGLQTVTSPIYSGTIPSLDKSATNPRHYYYPYDAYAYFEDPSNRYDASKQTPGLARAKDTYILISAGPDRTYGTEDDICSFGALFP